MKSVGWTLLGSVGSLRLTEKSTGGVLITLPQSGSVMYTKQTDGVGVGLGGTVAVGVTVAVAVAVAVGVGDAVGLGCRTWRCSYLHFKRSAVDAAIAETPKHWAPLIVVRGWTELWIACVDGRAAR